MRVRRWDLRTISSGSTWPKQLCTYIAQDQLLSGPIAVVTRSVSRPLHTMVTSHSETLISSL